jgi:hypothetical protein
MYLTRHTKSHPIQDQVLLHKPMLSDIVYGLGNQQEGGWLQGITLFNENHNAIFFIHTSGYKKIHPQSKWLWNSN